MAQILSLLRTKRFWLLLLGVAFIVLFVVLRSTTARVVVENLTPPKLPKWEGDMQRVQIDQNWDANEAQKFHHMGQGTSTLPVPYDWLLALEEPERTPWGLLLPRKKGMFTANNYIERYGFIRSSKSEENPDALPIGFAKSEFQNLKGYPTTTSTVGFTCAACHTGRLVHENKEYLIEGGAAVTDLGQFSKGLGAALGQTMLSAKMSFLPNKRFDRFARNVLGDTYSETTKAKLSKTLASVLSAGARASDVIDVVEGYGRLDALNRIGNQAFSLNIDRRENYTPINAPVNYPHIWTTSWFDWVQYDASIMQPLVRNSGEALGVHANLNTTVPIDEGRFASSIPIRSLDWIEETLAGKPAPMQAKAFSGLLAPKWPASLGAIDTTLAAKGAGLYTKHCQKCHLPPLTGNEIFSDEYFKKIKWQTSEGLQQTDDAYLALNVIDLKTIGTDSAQADVLEHRTVNTASDGSGQMALGLDATICTPLPAEGDLNYNSENKVLSEIEIKDGPMVSFALALGALVQQVNETWMDANNIPESERPNLEGNRPNCLQAGQGYKARPLNGVWATGPFLHNGSVPTLDDLLRPADQRPRFVRLGDSSFDEKKVGLAQNGDLNKKDYPVYQKGYFILDTALDGNHNTGHAFGASEGGDKTGMIGPALSDEDRDALIEYLKTL